MSSKGLIRFVAGTVAALATLCGAALPAAAQTFAELALDMSGPASADPGDDVTYQITVTNLGGADNDGVQFINRFPLDGGLNPLLTLVSITQTSGTSVWTCAPIDTRDTRCTSAGLVDGETATFDLIANIPLGTPPATDITNQATVTATGGTIDGNDENNTGSSLLLVNGGVFADLGITKSAPDQALADSDITYTIELRNDGPDTATGVTLTDPLPGDLTFVSLTSPGAPWNCTTPAPNANGTVQCTIGSLAPGDTASFTIVAHVPFGTVQDTVYTNQATVTGNDIDQNTENDLGTASTFIKDPVPDLTITKTHILDGARGSTLTYTIGVSNGGTLATSGTTTVTDTLPDGMSAFAATGLGWNCSLGQTMVCTSTDAIAPGDSFGNITLTAQIDESTASSVVNTATVSTPGETNTGNNSASDPTTIVSLINLGVSKAGPFDAIPGSTVEYQIGVINNGLSPANGVVLTDTLPPELTFLSLVPQGGWNCTTPAIGSTGTISCTVATMAAQTLATFTLETVLSPAATAAFSNSATITTTDADLFDLDDSSTSTVAVVIGPDLTITKTGPATADPSSTIAYAITVANAGPLDMTGVVMSDTLPAGTTFSALTAPGGWACTTPAVGSPGTVSCTIATLAAAASGSFTVSLTLPSTGGTITNTATVSGADFETNTANNTASATTTSTGTLGLGIGFDVPNFYAVGQVLEVRYLVTNTGPVTINGVSVADARVPAISCPLATLAPGASTTCIGSYTVTAADIAAGSLTFTATASGNGVVLATASATIVSGAAAVIAAFGELGTGFVETRNKLLSNAIDPPGLNDRGPPTGFTVTESNGEPTLNFSASLFQSEAGDAAATLASGATLPFNAWIDGTFTLHTRANGGGSFGVVGMGGDYLVTPDLLLGAALYIDYMSDTTAIGTISGRGALVGPYLSVALTPGITFDGSLFYGGSWNDAAVPMFGQTFRGSFSTQRLVARAKVEGEWLLDQLVIRPNAALFLSTESAGAYTVRDGAGNAIPIAGFSTNTLNLGAGATIERSFTLDSGLEFTPQAGFRLGSVGTGAGLALSDPFGTGLIGFTLAGENWTFRSAVEMGLWASSLKAASWKGSLSGRF